MAETKAFGAEAIKDWPAGTQKPFMNDASRVRCVELRNTAPAFSSRDSGLKTQDSPLRFTRDASCLMTGCRFELRERDAASCGALLSCCRSGSISPRALTACCGVLSASQQPLRGFHWCAPAL